MGKLSVPEFVEPIFTTCDSSKGFYKLVVSNFGTMTLQDGDGVPLFCSFRTATAPENMAAEISAELKKYFSNAKASNQYISWLAEKFRATVKNFSIGKKIQASRLLELPFADKWADFLWENNFLATDPDPINSLANLLLVCIRSTVISTTETFENPRSRSKKSIVQLFRQCIDSKMGEKHVSLAELLKLSDNGFLQWVAARAKKILDYDG